MINNQAKLKRFQPENFRIYAGQILDLVLKSVSSRTIFT